MMFLKYYVNKLNIKTTYTVNTDQKINQESESLRIR